MYFIIENNPFFIVVYKKPGIDFHHQGDTQGLFESVKAAENCSELYPVHRLDKVTSGLLVMAKTAAANRELSAQFAARQVCKFYLAISQKKPKKKQGLIKGDMERTRRSAWKLLPTGVNPAVTQFISEPIGQGRRLFLIKPHTGKTHQIRVALKSLGSPIMGDILYGDSSENAAVDRVYLHAYALSFSLNKKTYSYQVMPQEGHYFTDESFLAAVAAFHHPHQLTWPGV